MDSPSSKCLQVFISHNLLFNYYNLVTSSGQKGVLRQFDQTSVGVELTVFLATYNKRKAGLRLDHVRVTV